MDKTLHVRSNFSLQCEVITLLDITKGGTNLHAVSSLVLQNTSLLLSEQELEEFCSQQI